MPNITKKRRRGDISAAEPNVSSLSLSSATAQDSIDSLLAEMAGTPAAGSVMNPLPSQVTGPSPMESQEELADRELCDPTLASRPLTSTQRARIATWNRSMLSWQKSPSGSYTTGLLPSFDVEMARHFKVQALSAYLLDACKELKMPAFERWLIDSKLEDRGFAASFSDPVLSGSATVAFDASQRLIEEILETGAMSRVDAKKLVQDLCRRTHTAVGEIAQQHTFHLDRAPLRKGDRIDLEGHAPVYTLVYHRKSWKKPFCIKLNSTHYDKLKAMFERVHGGLAGGCSLQWTESMTGKATKLTHSFNLLVMVLMLRYSSLSGGQLLLDLRGGGMQGAVHGDVFKVLRKHFSDQPLFECFGSPLNAYLPTFGSAFSADLDWHFGSMGNFLDMTIESGCCEANPPFSPGMMNVMAEKIESNLLVADELSSSLTFFVIVPNAGDNKDSQRAAAKRFGGVSLQKMRASTTCRKHILLSAKEHGYVEGAQHLRSTRYKESLYDTSVVILQSREARLRELDINALEAEIRIAFVSRHREETDRRKQERENDTANSLPVHLSTCATLD